MKIAMVGQKGIPATYGGVERHVEELSAALSALGHEITVYSRPHYAKPVPSCRGVRVKTLPSIATKHLDAFSHSLLSTLHALGRNYDIVHYHGIGPSLVCPIARLSGARVVVTVHALDWRREKWGRFARFMLMTGEKVAAKRARRVITVSRRIQEYLQERYGLESALIPNGVSTPDIRPLDALRRRADIGSNGFLLYLGRFVPEKGCRLLVAAFRGVVTNKKLVMAGDIPKRDPYFAQLQEAAADDARIIFPGGLYGIEKSEALSNAGLFLLPSTVEGMPIGLLEAMSYGRCVAASDIPENRTMLQDDGEPLGMLFRSGDADDLRATIQRALQNPIESAALGRRAAERVRKRHDWTQVARLTLDVYKQALA